MQQVENKRAEWKKEKNNYALSVLVHIFIKPIQELESGKPTCK